MGWILSGLLLIDWIVMFIHFYMAVKYSKIYEKTEDVKQGIIASKHIKWFLVYWGISIGITLVLIIYSIFG